MPAPSSTVWGNTITGSNSSYQGKIGIYLKTSVTATLVTVNVEVWFWSKNSVDDRNNSYYYNSNSTSATSLIGSRTIKHTVSSSEGWSTSNQTKLGSATYNYPRNKTAYSKSFAAKFTGIDVLGSSNVMSVTSSVSIPALASYSVKYNANGGSGEPSEQTKWYGEELTLRDTTPKKTGHGFKGWATSKGGSVAYAPGAKYTANAAVTLYAVWKADTYTVEYDADGGSGEPTSQTKTYGQDLTLSTIKPTNTGYNFKGWATSSGGSVAYSPGAKYTANSAVTLYAVWEVAYTNPRIELFEVWRSNEAGSETNEGKHATASFIWETDEPIQEIKIAWKLSTSSTYPEENVETVEVETPPGKEGSVLKTFGGSLSTEKSYTILVTVSDSKGSSQKVTTLSSMILNIDFLPPAADGDVGGAAIGKAAEEDGVFDVGYESKFSGGIKNIVADKVTDLNDLKTPNTYVSINNSASTYAHLPTGLSGTFTIEVLSAGAEGQIMQRITSCTKNNHLVYVRHYYQEAWGEWVRDFNVLLYYNTSGSNGTITLNESVENFSYIEIFYCDNKGKSGGCFKLFEPHGKTICLSEIGASTSTVTYIRRTTYTISGNTITPDLTTAGYVEISGTSISHSGAGSNYLKIAAVIGRERSRA